MTTTLITGANKGLGFETARQLIGRDGLGGIDVLVNNAGVEERAADNAIIGAADVTADLMRTTFDTNVFGDPRVPAAAAALAGAGHRQREQRPGLAVQVG